MRWNTILSAALFSKISFLLLFTQSLLFADYAWIPKYKSLWTKLGIDYTGSKENIASDGERNDVLYQGSRAVDFTEYRLWLEGEYGVAQNVSAYLRPNFLWNSINPISGAGTGFPSAGGLGDVYAGLKWGAVKGPFLLTPELLTKIPAYSSNGLATDELPLGDGDFSIGTLIHAGYRLHRLFVVDLSPGFLYRSNDYKAQLLFQGMVGYVSNPIFIRLFFDWKMSMGKEARPALVMNNPDPLSGGTFARLSREADVFSLGVKAGVKVHESYRVDLNFQQSLFGREAPYYWQIGINFFAPFDFYQEEKKIKVKEVPFDSEQSPEGP